MQVYNFYTRGESILMKKVIVTGATGFIGYHLIKKLNQENIEVYALCRNNSKNIFRLSDFSRCHIIYINSWSCDEIIKELEEKEFDVFYHLAWEGASGELRKDYTIQLNNILFTCNMIVTAERLQCKKFICTGTICENQVELIYSHKEFIKSCYYLTAKKSAYQFAQNICKELEMKLVWCTFYHPIGKYNKKDQLIANTIYKMLSGDELKFGTAHEWFDIIAVEDLCNGLYLAGKFKLSKDRYFIGSGKPQRLYEYLEEVKKIIKPDVYMQYGSLITNDIEMRKEWLDIKEFQIETGYIPQYSLYDAVCATRDWIVHNYGM